MHRVFVVALAVVCALLAGCDDPPDDCDLAPPGRPRLHAECLAMTLPARHDRPDGARVHSFVRRIRAPGGGVAPGQLWLLAGGPGGSGGGLAELVYRLREAGVALDLYLPDHRGTGRSDRLDCPRLSAAGGLRRHADLGACAREVRAAWGDDLAGFSTSEAARDLGAWIDATREPGQQVFVWGGSYGTYWAHRYLQLFPAQPTGVILDSACLSATCQVSRADDWFDQGSRAIMAGCAADAVCRQHLGPDPAARLTEVVAQFRAGHCSAAGISQAELPELLATVATRSGQLLPALVARLERCDDGDVSALRHLHQALQQQAPSPDVGFSPVLQLHVILSELWETPAADAATLQRRHDDALLPTPGWVSAWDALRPDWPRYTRDAAQDGWATREVPVLILSGALDLQTPPALARSALAAWQPAHATHVVLPDGGHGLTSKLPCATSVFLQFLATPGGQLDTSCAAMVPAFAPSAEVTLRGFGTSDPWD